MPSKSLIVGKDEGGEQTVYIAFPERSHTIGGRFAVKSVSFSEKVAASLLYLQGVRPFPLS